MTVKTFRIVCEADESLSACDHSNCIGINIFPSSTFGDFSSIRMSRDQAQSLFKSLGEALGVESITKKGGES